MEITHDSTEDRVVARRARLRDAVERLSARARAGELVRLVLLPAALLLTAGFAVMALGWYGASHTHRQVEQIPYLISGGMIGLGLVVVGSLLLATALWISVLERVQAQADERLERRLAELEDRIVDDDSRNRRPLRASR